MNSPQAILITGGSSGIGAALARTYSAPGVSLFLVGRNLKRLENVAQECRSLGASVHIGQIDVSEHEKLEAFIEEMDERLSIDLVIANAGIVSDKSAESDGEDSRRVFETNVFGKFNTIYPLIPKMTARGRGQIAIMSSVDGLHANHNMPTFRASMAASRMFGNSLRLALRPKGINVSVIIPGPVITPLTQGIYKPGFDVIDAKTAALRIKTGLTRNKANIAFPYLNYSRHVFTSVLPMSVFEGLHRIKHGWKWSNLIPVGNVLLVGIG